jgi:hypothetical protein
MHTAQDRRRRRLKYCTTCIHTRRQRREREKRSDGHPPPLPFMFLIHFLMSRSGAVCV